MPDMGPYRGYERTRWHVLGRLLRYFGRFCSAKKDGCGSNAS
jgi:hypothetical protein